jgi:hypothetical protein
VLHHQRRVEAADAGQLAQLLVPGPLVVRDVLAEHPQQVVRIAEQPLRLDDVRIPDPTRLGIDVVFPAAMAGLAALLVNDRRECTAAVAGGVIATTSTGRHLQFGVTAASVLAFAVALAALAHTTALA